jgi:hypothetical protein
MDKKMDKMGMMMAKAAMKPAAKAAMKPASNPASKPPSKSVGSGYMAGGSMTPHSATTSTHATPMGHATIEKMRGGKNC